MLISQSEVDSFLGCERRHFYAFGEPTPEGRGIEPLTFGDALNKGLLGHSVLEVYYKALLEDYSHKAASEKAVGYLIDKAGEGVSFALELVPLMVTYFEIYGDERKVWIPLAVEQEFRLELGDSGLVFPFKVDAIFKHIPTGRMIVWDHKFLWNYYLPNSMKIMPQMPKYVYALQQLGYPVVDAMYNMVSTRKNASEPCRRMNCDIELNPMKMRQFMREQIMVMQRIKTKKEMDPEDWRSSIVRTASSFNCKNCMFLTLCTADLEGAPGRSLAIQNFYRPNTYGYFDITEPVEAAV
jgi:hypothetical protein